MLDINKVRNDTIGCSSVIHFNNAGASLMPRPVADAIRNYITEEERVGGYELADQKREELDTFYDLAAELLNAKHKNIAYTTNATDSYNKALSSVNFQQGDVVLISENDYPSNFMAFLSLQKRFGIKIITVKNTLTGEIDLDDLESKLKVYSPRLLSVTHVPTSSGLVQPAVAIGEIVKKYDTIYLLDACQSLGQIEVDAKAINADFISGTFRKFLRGPRGAGLLYVSDKALKAGLEPLYIDLRGAEWIEEDKYRARSDAKRFEDWETAYALMMGSKEALKYLLSLGIKNIETANHKLIKALKTGLEEIDGLKLQDKGKEQCNIVTFSIAGKSEKEAKKYFSEQGINIYTTSKSSAILDFEEKGVDWVFRVSPHYYNTENEIDRFLQVLKNI